MAPDQDMCVYEIANEGRIQDHEWALNPTKLPEGVLPFQEKVKALRAAIQTDFANPPCIFEYTPEEVEARHLVVLLRIGKAADKWWEKEETVEAGNVKKWLENMSMIRGWVDDEKERDFDGSCRHLEKQNAEFGRTGHGLWEYRLEVGEEAEAERRGGAGVDA